MLTLANSQPDFSILFYFKTNNKQKYFSGRDMPEKSPKKFLYQLNKGGIWPISA